MKCDTIVVHDGEALGCGIPVDDGFGQVFADVAEAEKR